MESQDGISVRSMRLKVLYTFDDDHKTNCLARWPQLLDIQTAQLDEKTQIGVIELKTCIQAIVSASPELVARLGRDYTVYAYDYSEYETPLVGQGMLSWVLASASPTPTAPAHQSKTMVTGRVCKNVLGLFSKGAQETLEVRLRLVPVPTVLQVEYLESIQKYRELSNVIPHDFDAQTWTNFIRQNPDLLSRPKPRQPSAAPSPVDQTGIESVHRMLSEGSTPRDFQSIHGNEPCQATSPAQSAFTVPSRQPSPRGNRELSERPQQQMPRYQNELIRPSSSASMRDDYRSQAAQAARRESIQSGYGSGDETVDPQPRKRAKLYRANPGKEDFNIERQPASLRVAASTAASVRIHRPTPVNPSNATTSRQSNDEPVRPPTPISRPSDMPRRARPQRSNLREASNQSSASYVSPYTASDDHPGSDSNAGSPEVTRYQGLFEHPFTMPSSPPVLDNCIPNHSSPAFLPEPDSGFMSGELGDLLGENIGTSLEESRKNVSNESADNPQQPQPQVNPDQHDQSQVSENQHESLPEPPTREAATLPPAPASAAGSRPGSRASARPPPKPLAPAPMSQSEVGQPLSSCPQSDPVLPRGIVQRSHTWGAPMSDFPTTDASVPQPGDESKLGHESRLRGKAGTRRMKQVQARLDKAIKEGQVPPYCENCGAIETPTWRRAYWKEMNGSEQDANDFVKDQAILFWRALERDEQDYVTKFKIFKKSLLDTDKGFVQITLCNPCGLWLHKFKNMRPENKWTKQPPNGKRRRGIRRGPLDSAPSYSRIRAQSSKAAESSPGRSDNSSPAAEEGTTPHDNDKNDNENDDEVQEVSSKRRRANSAEPRKTSDTTESRWSEQNAAEALRRAIQSSPARNMKSRPALDGDQEENLTPKPVRRALFPTSHNAGALNTPGLQNKSPRRSPRAGQSEDKENKAPDNDDNLDDLFEQPEFEINMPASPTPIRRSPRKENLSPQKRLSLPTTSPTRVEREHSVANCQMTPTKRAAQKLQSIQASTRLTPRQNKVQQPELPDLPPLPGDDSHEHPFIGGIDDMLTDIFRDGEASAAQFPFPPDSDWADFMQSDYISQAGSDENNNQQAGGNPPVDDDFIKAILADPSAVHNTGSFGLGDANPDQQSVIDPNLFCSDSFNRQLMDLGEHPVEGGA